MHQVQHFTSAPSGPERDTFDHTGLRHARDRNLGFAVGKYLQPPPMLFTRDGHNVFLGDMYRGNSAFLICSGPSLVTHDLSQLEERGILTCGVNNVATVVRPKLWVSVDDPGNFSEAIWYDPGIMKFVPMCHFEKQFMVRNEQEELVASEQVVGEMPAVFGFRRNEAFNAAQWLYEDTFNWGNHSKRFDEEGNKGSRSVMYVALRMLFYLGVRRVYLLGCDFRMREGSQNYAFDQDRTAASVRSNNSSYRILNARLESLKPYFAEAGFEVFNCTPNSGLQVFPYVPFEEAIAEAKTKIPTRMVTAGMYDRKQLEKDACQGQMPLVNCSNSPISFMDRERLPAITLITAVDRKSLPILSQTWPTWMKFKPWLREVPVLVLHDACLDPSESGLVDLCSHADVKFVPYDLSGVDGPGRFTRAFITAPAEHVTTPWYLKLDPHAVASSDIPWADPAWFESDEEKGMPVFVSHAWGYTKPTDVIEKLDRWANTIPGLSDYPPLNLAYEVTADRLVHPTISSWCFFGRTDWTCEIASYLSNGLPCQAHDTLLHYCAARRTEYGRRVSMKSYGWEHHFGKERWIYRRCSELM